MHFSRAAVLALFPVSLCLANAGCASNASEPASDVEDVTKAVSTHALVDGNTAFATDLYGELAKGSGNVFFSPYSISAALGMTYAGARAGTASAMKGTLHLPSGNVHTAFRGLETELAKRSTTQAKGGDPFQLSVANSLWGEKTQTFAASFEKILKDDYGAGLERADFLNKPDAERTRINGWVSNETNKKIQDLLPSGILKSDTKLVLVNAIYFKASWSSPFVKSFTQKQKFTTLDGSKVDAEMMTETEHMKYASEASYEAVALPYVGNDVELLAIAPTAGTFASFEQSLDAAKLDAIYGKLADTRVQLHLPKFKVAGASVPLKDTLTKLGMGVAFANNADFSGMTGKPDTKIGDVVHKAFISLDEKGTEAAAATAVIMIGKSAMPRPAPEVTFNRPFIFAIRDVPTGAILFLGRIANPKL